jgi:hypothetical protein
MAKQTINVGTTANDKKGDSLRAAFQKVNANFTELYTQLGLTDPTLNLGAFTFTGSVMSTDDSTNIVIDKPITVNGEITVDGDIVPKTDLGASLGTPTRQFKSLYVSDSTVYFGGVPLSLEAGSNTLKINNVPISQSITYANIPNAPTDVADLTDNDGLLGGGGAADLGDLVIYDGAITTDGVSSIYIAPNGEGYGYVTVPNDTSAVSGAATVIGNSRNDGGGVQISAYNSTWQFKPNGTLLFPTLTVPIEDNANPSGTGQVLKFSDSTQQAIIFGPESTENDPAAQRIIIQGAPGYTGTAGEGGDVYVWAGPGGSVNGGGGDIKVRAGQGNGSGNGGYLNFQAGDSGTTGYGGYINIESGSANTSGQGGDITIRARDGGNIDLYTTDSAIRLNTDGGTWSFAADDTLTLPNGATIFDNDGPGGGWLSLAPANAGIGQALVIYPTAGGDGDHIHLTADGGDTELYLGNDNHYVKLVNGGNVQIQAATANLSATAAWTFGTNGAITTTDAFTVNVPDGVPTSIGTKSNDSQFWDYNYGSNLATTGGTGTGLTVDVGDGGSGYAGVSINTAGTGYTDGDVITVTNGPNNGAPIASTVTFAIGVSGTNSWQLAGGLKFPDNTVQTTAAESFSFSVAADDSTQRAISNNELIKFIGAGGITTSSDAEGYITITGSGGSVSSLVNSTKTLSLGSDGSLTSNGALTIKTPNGIPSSVSNWVGGGGWNSPPYSNLATTGGTGTGLTVNVSAADGGYININYITIATAGTGYTAGDVITITNENNLSGTFVVGVAGTRDWQFGIDGGLTLPLNGIIQSVQSGNYQSKVTVSPLQILSQARTSRSQSYTVADGDFTSASGDGAGLITFVNPSGSMTEWLLDTMEYGGVYERTVRINGAGPEYQYNYFGGGDSIVLSTYPAAGAVTDIRFSYTQISKIDISPDEGVFNIQSESGQDIDIQSGSDVDIVATDRVYMISGTNMRLQAGNGNVQISTNYAVPNATQRDWQFDTNGQLTLPNGAVLRNTVNGAIAFGIGAGQQTQGANAIAIGYDAGYYPQGADAVAIGRSAGEDSQGANAIAIGLFAGKTNQAANSIVLNATGVALDQTTANTFTVAPIRNISATSGVLQYNASTKEVSYSLNVTAETFNTDQITIVGNRISTTVTNANLELECNGTGGVVINTVAEATTTSTARSVGYLGIPASAVTTTATLTIADAGEHIYLTTTGQTITIPANASVAYPIGTTLTFIAGPSATTATIAIDTDTMYLAGTGTTGSRTLAAHGMATAVKVAATTWYINGTGLT